MAQPVKGVPPAAQNKFHGRLAKAKTKRLASTPIANAPMMPDQMNFLLCFRDSYQSSASPHRKTALG